MERIETQSSDEIELAKDALSWVVCAKRQLKAIELQYALAVNVGDICLDEDNIPDLDDILSVCSGLVTLDEQSQIVRLVHYTTQDYFERTQQKWFPQAEKNIAIACITYLTFDLPKRAPAQITTVSYSEKGEGLLGKGTSIADRPSVDKYIAASENGEEDSDEYDDEPNVHRILKGLPLYEYAVRFWGRHGRLCSLPYADAARFLGNINHIHAASWALTELRIKPFNAPNLGNITQLHFAAYFGLDQIIEHLLNEMDVDAKDKWSRTPLYYAAWNGLESTSRLLLDAGASADCQDASHNYVRTPLYVAIHQQHERVVQHLLGVLPDTQENRDLCTKLLPVAVQRCNEDLVKLMIQAGADANADLYGSAATNHGPNVADWVPLGVAIRERSASIVKILLEAGANVNTGADTLTPLIQAASMGDTSIVKILLKAGANMDQNLNSDLDDEPTALECAELRGHTEVAEMLREAGAKDRPRDEAWKEKWKRSWNYGNGYGITYRPRAGLHVQEDCGSFRVQS